MQPALSTQLSNNFSFTVRAACQAVARQVSWPSFLPSIKSMARTKKNCRQIDAQNSVSSLEIVNIGISVNFDFSDRQTQI